MEIVVEHAVLKNLHLCTANKERGGPSLQLDEKDLVHLSACPRILEYLVPLLNPTIHYAHSFTSTRYATLLLPSCVSNDLTPTCNHNDGYFG